MTIQVENLSFAYTSPLTGDWPVLSGINLKIQTGEIVAITGPTGSGKTTFIQHLNGLLQPTSGKIIIDGDDLTDPGIRITDLHRRIGLVFQFPENQLFEEKVFDDIAYGPRNLKLSEEEIESSVRSALKMVGLDFDRYRDQSPFHLSGGEKRRVAIAGIIAMDPQMLILDEPTVGLDWSSALMIEQLVKKLGEQNRTVLFVTHDMDLIGRLADRVLVMEKGQFVFDGEKSALFQDADLLKRTGLEVPRIVSFMSQLKKDGLSVSTNVFTMHEAKEAIRRAVKK